MDTVRYGYPFGAICEGLCEWIPEEQASLMAAGLLGRR
jgi:hypothetical protein